jgi:hypothetical protein
VFATATGRRDSPENVRARFLARSVERANVALADANGEPIGHVTPHSLRRTFISLLLAADAPVPYVMAQAGHADPKMTLGIYASVIASKTDHGATVDELVREGFGHSMGTEAVGGGYVTQEPATPEGESSWIDEEAADGIRTHDLLHGKQTL